MHLSLYYMDNRKRSDETNKKQRLSRTAIADRTREPDLLAQYYLWRELPR